MKMTKKSLIEHYKLEDSIKHYKGYKVKPPEETIDFIEKAFKKIDLKVRYIPNSNTALRKYHPFQAGSTFLHPSVNDKIILLKTNGKGVKPKLAQASAIAELIERFTAYGLAMGSIAGYLGSMKREHIWEKRREKNKFIQNELPFHSMGTSDLIDNKYIEKYESMAKSICYSLTQKKLFSFPEEFIIKMNGSNGLASGNTLEEATLHAIFEVIERLGIFYLLDNLPYCDKISEDSVTHPTLKKLIKVVSSLDVNFEMLDLSYLFNIPVIATIFDNPAWNIPSSESFSTMVNIKYPKLVIGVDTDPQDAAMRCFIEFIQGSQPVAFASHNDWETRYRYELSKLPLNEEVKFKLKSTWACSLNGNPPSSVDLQKYFRLERKEKSILDIKSLYDLNQKIEINRVVNELKKLNIEVFVQDITHPLLKFPVSEVILSGGNKDFSNILINAYFWIVLGEKKNRYRLLKNEIVRKLNPDQLHTIIRKQEWCSDPNHNDLINLVIKELIFGGPVDSMWGVPINKYYFIGTLFLRMEKYEQAEHCFQAALSGNLMDTQSLIALAYVFNKTNRLEEYKDIMDLISSIDKDSENIKEQFRELENPIVNPNPFEPCDLKCKSRNKPYLCEQCFFNYVPENIFMKKIIDNFLKTR